MEQYKFSPSPKSFIPPALKHSFGNGEEGFQKLLEEFGICYVATRFDKARHYSAPLHPQLTWENSVLLVDRGKADCAWNTIGCEPAFAFDRPFLTLHWANILHQDPAKNPDVVHKWIDFIHAGVNKHGLLIAPDTRSCLTQYLHRMLSTVHEHDGEFSIDLNWKNDLSSHLIDHSFFIELTPSPFTDFKICGADAKCIRNTIGSTIFQITPMPGSRKIFIKLGQEM